MELNEYINKLFAAAKEAGFEACECRYSTDENMEISVFSGEIDEYSLASGISLSLRGLYNGRMGRASTRVLDEASIGWLVESAKSLRRTDRQRRQGVPVPRQRPLCRSGWVQH